MKLRLRLKIHLFSRVSQVTRAALKKLRCWRIRMRNMLSSIVWSRDGHGIISVSQGPRQLSGSVSLQCDDPVSALGMWSRPISGYHPVCHSGDAERDSSNRRLHPRLSLPPSLTVRNSKLILSKVTLASFMHKNSQNYFSCIMELVRFAFNFSDSNLLQYK